MKMFQILRFAGKKKASLYNFIRKQTFLTQEYKCSDAWNQQTSSPLLNKVNLNDFYNILSQNFTSKGVISAIDVDIFANAINDTTYLEELKDLLHKLRSSAETSNMLESTQHATVRKYLEFGTTQGIIEILKEPMYFGVFLDNYSANILLDKLVTSLDFHQAADVASLVMLQEEYTNDITNALCQYACYKFVVNYSEPEAPALVEDKKQKIEEIKIRIKFLRNPYFDDHFDIKDTYTLSCKTLAWMSEKGNYNLSHNLEMIGWLTYRKFDKIDNSCRKLIKSGKIYPEVLSIIQKECEKADNETKTILENCLNKLTSLNLAERPLEDSLKKSIEDAINKTQPKDISEQKQLFKTWEQLREQKLEEQTKRLDRAKRIELIQSKQNELKTEEQKLWFFEKEEEIDLQIEEKEKLIDTPKGTKKSGKQSDENYIPPEIIPRRR